MDDNLVLRVTYCMPCQSTFTELLDELILVGSYEKHKNRMTKLITFQNTLLARSRDGSTTRPFQEMECG